MLVITDDLVRCQEKFAIAAVHQKDCCLATDVSLNSLKEMCHVNIELL